MSDQDNDASGVVLFGSPVSAGHIRPLMPLAKRLVERGRPVIWAISGDGNEPAAAWKAPLSELGVTFLDLDAVAPFLRDRDPDFSGGPRVFRRIVARANDVGEGATMAITRALEGRRIALGVYDFFALWFYVALRRLGVENRTCIVSGFPGALHTLPAAFGDDPIYQGELAALRASGCRGFEGEPRAFVIPSDEALKLAAFSSPHLCPGLPAWFRLLGVARESLPSVQDLPAAPAEHRALLERLRGERELGKRVVLLSLGTVVTRMFARMGATHVAFLKRLYTTLAASALRSGAVVVASTCDSSPAELGVDEATLGPAARERVVAMPFVPQPLLFAHGLVNVMLTHGGGNTFHEALLSGVPLLVSPGFGDQPAVAQVVARLGVGVCVEAITCPGMSGAEPLERVGAEILPAMLEPGNRWKVEAMRLGELLAQENGLDAAEALLDASSSARAPRPAR